MRRQTGSSDKPKRDYYEVLGVEKGANEKDVKQGFYKKAKEFHPDANPDNPEAEDKFKEAQEAYGILSDKEKRSQYDTFGHDGPGGGFPGGGFGGGGAGPDFSGVNLDDLFENLFGFGGGRRGARGPVAGRDLAIAFEMEFMDAVNGVTKDVMIRRDEQCGTCSGSGVQPGTEVIVCVHCKGAGMQTLQQGFMFMQQTCPYCSGRGKITTDCKPCSGQGLVEEAANIKVKIPPGVNNGMRVRVRGAGSASPSPNGPRGEVWVECHVREHEEFDRQDSDIHLTVDIPIATAVLGGKIAIPTLEKDVNLKVPKGTQPYDRTVIRGKGIAHPQTGRKGHQYIHFNVTVPTELTEEQQKLYEQLHELEESGGEINTTSGSANRRKKGKSWFRNLWSSTDAG